MYIRAGHCCPLRHRKFMTKIKMEDEYEKLEDGVR
jgi:hypothetical protein